MAVMVRSTDWVPSARSTARTVVTPSVRPSVISTSANPVPSESVKESLKLPSPASPGCDSMDHSTSPRTVTVPSAVRTVTRRGKRLPPGACCWSVEATLAIVEGSDPVSVRHPVETAVSAREAAQEILRNIIFLKIVRFCDLPRARRQDRTTQATTRQADFRRGETINQPPRRTNQPHPAVPHLSDSLFPIRSHRPRHRTTPPPHTVT